MVGVDLDGNEVSVEADELAARMYQHEIDHLDGVLMTERLDEDQQREARKVVRELMMFALRARAGRLAAPLSDRSEPVGARPPVPPRHPRRLAFLGTPEAAVPPLRALVTAGFDVALVVSQPDRRRGRGRATSPTPVKAAALELGLPVTDQVDEVRAAGVELGVVVAFGQILRASLLAEVPMVNVHFSLLPRWRGAAPVERALLAGDATTGVCVMEVVEALDAGGVHASAEVPIDPSATAASLRAELADVGADLLVEALTHGLVEPLPQEGEPTYAAKIAPEDLHLDWSRPAEDLDRVIRVGGAWTTWRGSRLRIGAARPGVGDAGGPGRLTVDEGEVVVGTASGPLVLVEVQPEGKARQPATDWAHGARLAPDDRLGP